MEAPPTTVARRLHAVLRRRAKRTEIASFGASSSEAHLEAKSRAGTLLWTVNEHTSPSRGPSLRRPRREARAASNRWYRAR
ncbi:hypothetical protein KM043_008144 [Ampulex compressa]|nr:hypothetical protein KM043_008144 [Ampulex compressa]